MDDYRIREVEDAVTEIARARRNGTPRPQDALATIQKAASELAAENIMYVGGDNETRLTRDIRSALINDEIDFTEFDDPDEAAGEGTKYSMFEETVQDVARQTAYDLPIEYENSLMSERDSNANPGSSTAYAG